MTTIVIDFETRSRVNIKLTNTYRYARDPSTEVLCCSISINGGPTRLWKPEHINFGAVFPFELHWPDCVIAAFNAEFELLIWNEVCTKKYGWPELPPDRITCLQARAAYCGFPRKLKTVGDAIGLGAQGKDDAGHAIMLKLSKPQKAKLNGCMYVGGKFDDGPEKHAANERYCIRDTDVEKLVDRLCPPLLEHEQRLWVAHQAINARGVPVDVDLCRNAKAMVDRELTRLSERCADLTNGSITAPTQLERIKKWLVTKDVDLPNMQENTINAALESGELPEDVAEVLWTRKLSRDAAVSKFAAALNHAESDGRCRAAHVFYKAGPGRWAGGGVQFQNLRRLNDGEIDWLFGLADRISESVAVDDIYEELLATDLGVIPTLAKLVRMAICAKRGKTLTVRDYSSIEMRVLHWMANDIRQLKVIEDHDAGIGIEPYVLSGAQISGKKIEEVGKFERSLGKVQILGCGYLQGAANLANFAKNYGMSLSEEQAHEIVQLYRRSFPAVKSFWYRTNDAAVRAVTHVDRTSSGPVEFYYAGCTLNARLPSGREIKYYDPRIEDGMYGPEIWAMDVKSGNHRPVGLPILIENLDQGISRDLLADALVKCHEENLPVVLHVHDEIVLEHDLDDEDSPSVLEQIMADKPAWAADLPVHSKAGQAKRYTK